MFVVQIYLRRRMMSTVTTIAITITNTINSEMLLTAFTTKWSLVIGSGIVFMPKNTSQYSMIRTGSVMMNVTVRVMSRPSVVDSGKLVVRRSLELLIALAIKMMKAVMARAIRIVRGFIAFSYLL